ncbi:penicillin-binding transpeptidase domain-containing protein [Heyndrickxia coagulans]|uniref:penicillin-binding transpeptidase domain-containing protein n=1 Tax=Heyndrickxia coagulans TaxID=1398 RepID=UPI002E1AAB67|nr:penicillin-binding transpeptidase domain-containing protein [Heyndrickxia coagulans]MED4346063.1 penicillin-binding transpeptidase domain-containing protein [Heyndrickxia coagulans]
MRKYVFVVALLLGVFAALAGCEKTPTPNERLADYVKAWEQEKFAEMYQSYVSASTKKTYAKKEVADRYKKVYRDLNVSDLNISYKPLDKDAYKNKEKVTVPVKISFQTSAGKVAYKDKVALVKEKRDKKENWYVDWKPDLILPHLAKGDTIKVSEQNAVRGEILDRNGKALAKNGSVYQIGVIPEQLKGDKQADMQKAAGLLGMSADEIKQKLDEDWVQPHLFVPLKKVPMEKKDLVKKVTSIPGFSSQTVDARVYPYGKAAAHLTGYIGAITGEELKKLEKKGYTAESVIGKRGLEQLYDQKLRGRAGEKIYIEKQDGSTYTVAEQKVKNGENIKVTIDAELQQKIYNQMKGDAGTAAAIQPKTGDVLALVSTPAFDPNDFISGMSSSTYTKLEKDPGKPLINRFALTYAPGSTIKPVTAAIALDTGTTTAAATKTITGTSWQKSADWGSYKVTRVHANNSPENMEKALVLSDNIFFAQTALDIGADKFAKGLKGFGFGEDIPFAYPLKASQISSTGKFSSDIQLADTGYGQGQMQMNILHLAISYTPFLNSGDELKPNLLVGEKTKVWKHAASSKTTGEISGMLRQVVADPSGTAHAANISGAQLAGKTGTAELKKSQKDQNGKENGFFVVYDEKNPNMLVAMLIEDVKHRGGSGLVVNKAVNLFR